MKMEATTEILASGIGQVIDWGVLVVCCQAGRRVGGPRPKFCFCAQLHETFYPPSTLQNEMTEPSDVKKKQKITSLKKRTKMRTVTSV